jgi:predicted DNA-binding protein (UPF0251 family)
VDSLSSTTGIVALAAAGVAVIALIVASALAFRLRRVRNAQRAVLGDLGARDLVTHAADITEQFRGLHQWVDDVAAKLHDRMDLAEHRLDGTIAYRALIRYDAYGEMSGRQSTSIALLDANRSGVVLSSIHHRDQARLYAKQVHNGEGEIELSPEEAEAVRLALSQPPTQEPAAERA